MLSDYGVRPHEINVRWTEEQLALILRKRVERLNRLAKELRKQRGTASEHADEGVMQELTPRDAKDRALSWDKPRRVSEAALFMKINAMRAKGGGGNVPLC